MSAGRTPWMVPSLSRAAVALALGALCAGCRSTPQAAPVITTRSGPAPRPVPKVPGRTAANPRPSPTAGAVGTNAETRGKMLPPTAPPEPRPPEPAPGPAPTRDPARAPAPAASPAPGPRTSTETSSRAAAPRRAEAHTAARDDRDDRDDDELDFVEPVSIDRTLPNGLGDWDVRVGARHTREGRDSVTAPYVQVFGGVLPRIGVEFRAPYVLRDGDDRARGVGDLGLALKGLVAGDGRDVPAVVVGVDGEIATGDEDDGLGKGAHSAAPFLALLYEARGWTLQGNVARGRQYGAAHDDDEHFWRLQGAVAAPRVADRVHLLCEVDGTWTRGADDPSLTVAGALRWDVAKDQSVGLAVPFGVNRSSPDWAVELHYQIEF